MAREYHFTFITSSSAKWKSVKLRGDSLISGALPFVVKSMKWPRDGRSLWNSDRCWCWSSARGWACDSAAAAASLICGLVAERKDHTPRRAGAHLTASRTRIAERARRREIRPNGPERTLDLIAARYSSHKWRSSRSLCTYPRHHFDHFRHRPLTVF